MRRLQQADAPALALHQLDFLLGVGRTTQELAQFRADRVPYNTLYRFTADRMPEAQFRELWSRHEHLLRAEAARRGIPLPDPRTFRLDERGRALWTWRQRCGA